MNISVIKKELSKMDPKLDLKSETGLAAQFLLSSAQVGPSVKKVAKFMNVPESSLTSFGILARKNKIWYGKKVQANWFKKDGAVAFWMDVNVVLGMMKRVN